MIVREVLFRILNFTIFIALIIYILHTRVIPAIYKKLAAQKAHRDKLLEQQQQAQLEQKALLKKLTKDRKEFERLAANVAQWKLSREKAYNNKQLRYEQYKKLALERHAQQQAFYTTCINSTVIHQKLFDTVTHELTDYFSKAHRAHEYIHATIQLLSKKDTA